MKVAIFENGNGVMSVLNDENIVMPEEATAFTLIDYRTPDENGDYPTVQYRIGYLVRELEGLNLVNVFIDPKTWSRTYVDERTVLVDSREELKEALAREISNNTKSKQM